MLDGLTILYKSSVDLFFYVMGSSYENELLLMSALDVLFDSLNMILKKEFEKKALMEHLDMVMMAVDEICDHGILLEHDPQVKKNHNTGNDWFPGRGESGDCSELRRSSTRGTNRRSCSSQTAGFSKYLLFNVKYPRSAIFLSPPHLTKYQHKKHSS